MLLKCATAESLDVKQSFHFYYLYHLASMGLSEAVSASAHSADIARRFRIFALSYRKGEAAGTWKELVRH
jgi:hypothetical protein